MELNVADRPEGKKTPKPPKVSPTLLLTEEKEQMPIFFFAFLPFVYTLTVVSAELCGVGVMSH